MDLDPAHIQQGLLIFILIVLSLALHEWGHAWMADRLGDDTPRSQGRVTLNPLAHIDIFGTLIIPLLGVLKFFGGFGFIGWAKPVQINPAALPRTGQRAAVTLAGPAMNALLALFATIAAGLLSRFDVRLHDLASLLLHVNVGLMIFNLLPIPPLDGSKFLMYWGGMSEETYIGFANWGWVILIIAINLPAFRLLLGKIFALALTPYIALYNLIA
ncbi:site-2 protease family protein [Opitutaceae bacterium TAV4]|uniref:site-2 protease family protein n=1 Tax=Geminisphaera colitermitum TaxID=1148786 RepID=UPI0005B852C3|nr:site-2 protease family protein [Geminisphaera colitermitum]RRJ96113.1 site-2 protease family protein [Opitutaceae bacterium TAV4]RRK00742.1 site-2 protease family protein [Opitutaceae bacterium TAV3]